MARRVFNNCVVNGVTINAKEFIQGTGEITLTGTDVSKVTDDHLVHYLRLNEKHNAKFEVFRQHDELETDPNTDVFGGTQYFYLDTTLVDSFDGVVTIEYNELENKTIVTVKGEVEDA